MKLIESVILNEGPDWKGCLMLSLPEYYAESIQSFALRNIPLHCTTKDGYESYTHATILYGFDQSVKYDDVEATLARLGHLKEEGIQITLGEIKRFECGEYDVIYIEVQNNLDLNTMHFQLKEMFNVVTSYPTYTPHITLAYVEPGSCQDIHERFYDYFYAMKIECNEMTYSRGPSESREREIISYEEFKKRI